MKLEFTDYYWKIAYSIRLLPYDPDVKIIDMIDIKLTRITEIEGPEKKRIIENVHKF